jgi:hypothetical protein
MKLARRGFLAGLAGAALVSSSAARAQRPTPIVLRRGINLWPWFSLTREFPAPRTDYAWPPFQFDRPVPTAADLGKLRQAGFDFVRIPVDPGPFLAMSAEQRKVLLGELAAAVDLALRHELAVVVNLQANAATHYWNPSRMLSGPTAPAFPAYRDLVAELARTLSRFDPQRVALEPVNEPAQECRSPQWDEMQRQLLGTARRAAPALTLIATGACGSMVSGLEALAVKDLAAFEPLLFTFHFYEPYLFSHQGAPWMTEPVYKALNAVPWPASEGSLATTLAAVRSRMAGDHERSQAAKRAAYEETERVLKVYFDAQPDKRFVDGYLEKVRAWGDRHGVAPSRILMGEFGALRSDSRYVAAGAADRARYVRDVRESAERYGFPWAFWNVFDGMGVMDDTTRRLDLAIIRSLGLVVPP